MRAILHIAILCAAWAMMSARPAAGEDIGLDDIGFIVGHWKGAGENAPEEVWLPPSEGVLPGFFRWPSANGRYVLELLTFRETGDGVTFHFKHFSPVIEAWEKDQANTYRLTRVEDDCLFMTKTGDNPDVPARIRHCRVDEETLEFAGAAEGESWDEVTFKLKFRRVTGSSP